MNMIYECDAPPQAYFELSDGVNLVRFVHQVYYFPNTEQLEDFLGAVRKELSKSGGFIFWRRRPQADPISCRFATSPPLSMEFMATQRMLMDLHQPDRWNWQ